jgi:D-xylose transport system substrate-binding protein
MSDDWLAVNALKNMENILTANQNQVDAVVDSYDGTAGGCIQALAGQNMAGHVLVSDRTPSWPLANASWPAPDHDGL